MGETILKVTRLSSPPRARLVKKAATTVARKIIAFVFIRSSLRGVCVDQCQTITPEHAAWEPPGDGHIELVVVSEMPLVGT